MQTKKMNRLYAGLVFILLSALSNIAVAQQSSAVTSLPPANWIRVRSIDVKHIALDLRFDWQKKQAYGTAAITLSPLHAANKIKLDAAMLGINAITLSNGTSLKYNYDGSDKNDALEIMLDKTYQPNQELTIKINYHTNYINNSDPNNIWGSNGKGIRFFQPTSTEQRKRKQIWSMGEPEGNRYWFPCYDASNDLRTTEFTATVGKEFTAISNGELIEAKINADGTKTFHWKMDKPYSNYRTSFVIGEYIDVTQNFKDVSLHSIGYADEKDAITATVERLPDMVKFFSELTGTHYPYKSYSQVFVQDLPWGIANAAASTQTENMVDDYKTHADFLYLWDALQGESLASQWFGNYLTVKDWSHLWLDKGLARYISWMYSEYKNSHDEFLLYQYVTDYTPFLGGWSAGVRQPIVTRYYDFPAALTDSKYTNTNYPYFGANLVLNMLRKHLGDDAWRKVLQHYIQSNAGKTVTTEDFRQAVEDITGEPMDWFFDQWMYKMGHPFFEVSKNYDAVKKQLTLTVKQVQQKDSTSSYPQADFFQGKIEIEIDDKIETVWLLPQAENVFTFTMAQQPMLVNFDYENTWIKEISFPKTQDEWLYQLANDKSIMGKYFAMTELINLANGETISASDKLKIFEGLKSMLASKVYWRLKYGTLLQMQSLYRPTTNNNSAFTFDDASKKMLLDVIKNNKAWVRASAISLLGISRSAEYADFYISYLNDESERVVNTAAIALGKSKSPKAFDALIKLKDKPSWKNQSLISTLYALKELGDARAYNIAIQSLTDSKAPHWTLATPVWDHRIAAANLLVSLNKASEGYTLIFEQFKKSLQENDMNDIFYNAMQTATLADVRGQQVFDMMKEKYKDDAEAMSAVTQLEQQFQAAIKK